VLCIDRAQPSGALEHDEHPFQQDISLDSEVDQIVHPPATRSFPRGAIASSGLSRLASYLLRPEDAAGASYLPGYILTYTFTREDHWKTRVSHESSLFILELQVTKLSHGMLEEAWVAAPFRDRSCVLVITVPQRLTVCDCRTLHSFYGDQVCDAPAGPL